MDENRHVLRARDLSVRADDVMQACPIARPEKRVPEPGQRLLVKTPKLLLRHDKLLLLFISIRRPECTVLEYCGRPYASEAREAECEPKRVPGSVGNMRCN